MLQETYLDLLGNITSLEKNVLPKDVFKKAVNDIQALHKLKYVYVRLGSQDEDTDQVYLDNYGGLTIAYKVPPEPTRHNIVWVSLAWCSPNDQFNKLIGRYVASSRYVNNNIVPIRLPNSDNIRTQLFLLFLPFLETLELF